MKQDATKGTEKEVKVANVLPSGTVAGQKASLNSFASCPINFT